MSVAFKQLKILITKYPLLRGMISYSLIWPTSSIVQQHIEGKRWGHYDWWRCLRFSLYGGLFVAPTLYAWIRISTIMWPQSTLQAGITKAIVEQMSYTPAAITCFYFIMSLLENKTVGETVSEVGKKFVPTYKVALSVWPLVGLINFTLIDPVTLSRVPFISVCSLLWTTFLAYMKHLEHHQVEEHKIL